MGMDEQVLNGRTDKDGWERVYQLHGKNITHSTLIELLQLGVVTSDEVREAMGLPKKPQ